MYNGRPIDPARCRCITIPVSEAEMPRKKKGKTLTLTEKELESILSFLGLGEFLSWVGEHYELTPEALKVAYGKSDVAAIRRITKKAEAIL